MKQNMCCNACGRELQMQQGILREDALVVKKSWGFFSGKDLEVHEFVLCEACYDHMVSGFQKPVSVLPKSEVLDGE